MSGSVQEQARPSAHARLGGRFQLAGKPRTAAGQRSSDRESANAGPSRRRSVRTPLARQTRQRARTCTPMHARALAQSRIPVGTHAREGVRAHARAASSCAPCVSLARYLRGTFGVLILPAAARPSLVHPPRAGGPRKKWADSDAFHDTPEVVRQALSADWARCLDSHNSRRFLAETDQSEASADEVCDGCFDVLWDNADLVCTPRRAPLPTLAPCHTRTSHGLWVHRTHGP